MQRGRQRGHLRRMALCIFQAQVQARCNAAARQVHACGGLHAGDSGHFRQFRQVAVIGISQAVAEGELRVVARLAHIVDVLRGVARPGEAELALEVVRHAAIRLAQQHIGDARTFRTRQPRCHESVGGIDLAVHPQRTAADEHRHHRNALGLQALEQFQVAVIARLVHQVGNIALEFGVGLFTEHHDGRVRLLLVFAFQ